jgi:hypothetical protein
VLRAASLQHSPDSTKAGRAAKVAAASVAAQRVAAQHTLCCSLELAAAAPSMLVRSRILPTSDYTHIRKLVPDVSREQVKQQVLKIEPDLALRGYATKRPVYAALRTGYP